MLSIVKHLESLPSLEVESLMNRDDDLVRYANQIREQLSSKPTQSLFRVVAILVVTHTIRGSDGAIQHSLLCGSNIEHGYLGGAICAERAALCRTRFMDNVQVQKVVVTTDSHHGISPGALCREFLMSMGRDDMPVVITNNKGDQTTKCVISDLLPHPYLYRKTLRSEIPLCAETMASKVRSQKNQSLTASTAAVVNEDDERQKLIHTVIAAAEAANASDCHGDSLHPIRLSAAVVYSDGTTSTSYQMKGLEYGCTVDPVVQVIYAMEHRLNKSAKPVFLVVLDNYGVAHAPFAQARAQLTERGYYDDLEILVHQVDGQLISVPAKMILPQPPGSDAKLLTHDDFLNVESPSSKSSK
jgi:cytidine deaminase